MASVTFDFEPELPLSLWASINETIAVSSDDEWPKYLVSHTDLLFSSQDVYLSSLLLIQTY